MEGIVRAPMLSEAGFLYTFPVEATCTCNALSLVPAEMLSAPANYCVRSMGAPANVLTISPIFFPGADDVESPMSRSISSVIMSIAANMIEKSFR